MEEKVIFEYRAEREENGYHYILSRGGRRMEIKSTVPLDGFACEGHHARWARRLRHASRHGGMPRRAMRKTLDTFEQIYRDIYGNQASSPEEVK